MKFGRINTFSDPDAISYLPISPRLSPTVMMITPALGTKEQAAVLPSTHRNAHKFKKWISQRLEMQNRKLNTILKCSTTNDMRGTKMVVINNNYYKVTPNPEPNEI
jgi:hypothetical protein